MAVTAGSCLCKAVTFEVKGNPENVILCFCQHCAKNAGAPAQHVSKFKREDVQIFQTKDDMLKTYVLHDTLSESEKHKVFCADCGCTLWTIPMRHGGTHLMIRTSLLENGLEAFPPRVVFFASRATSSSLEQYRSLKLFQTAP